MLIPAPLFEIVLLYFYSLIGLSSPVVQVYRKERLLLEESYK
jgi:hypothetical protein